MAITASTTLISPFAFVKDTYQPTLCEEKPDICYPVNDFADWAFQVKIDEFGDDDGLELQRTFKAAALKLNCGELPLTGTVPNAWVANVYTLTESTYDGLAQFYRVTDREWGEYNDTLEANGFERIEVGDCFKIFIYEEVSLIFSGVLQARFNVSCTDCFMRVSDECYLSKVQWQNRDNAFDEIWVDPGIPEIDNIQLRGLLPFYLKEPQMNSDSSSITLSDQSVVKLYEVITEEWTLETNANTWDFHRCLKVMLAHDSVVINNLNEAQNAKVLSTGKIADAEYTVEWQKRPSLLGKGECTLTSSNPVSLRNLNCK